SFPADPAAAFATLSRSPRSPRTPPRVAAPIIFKKSRRSISLLISFLLNFSGHRSLSLQDRLLFNLERCLRHYLGRHVAVGGNKLVQPRRGSLRAAARLLLVDGGKGGSHVRLHLAGIPTDVDDGALLEQLPDLIPT